MVEQKVEALRVVGSIPTRPTNYKEGYMSHRRVMNGFMDRGDVEMIEIPLEDYQGKPPIESHEFS